MNDKENIKFTFKLDNKKTSSRNFVLFVFLGALFFGLAFYFFALDKIIYLIVDAVVGFVILFLFSRLKPNYIEFTVFDNHFIINHYAVISVGREYETIRVNFSEFLGCKIEPAFLKLRKDLVLTVQTPHGIADYPKLSISALSKAEIAQILIILNKLVEQNN